MNNLQKSLALQIKNEECLINVERVLIKISRIMRISFFLIFLIVFSASASTFSQSKRFSFELENVTIREVFDTIEAISEYIFFYSDKEIDVEQKTSINVRNEKVDKILAELLKGVNLNYAIVGRQVVIRPSGMRVNMIPEEPDIVTDNIILQDESIQITGTVTDADGNGIPGVAVLVKGTTRGVVTDLDGNYNIRIEEGVVLQFSYIGMQTREVVVTGEQLEIDITLEVDLVGLDEVVVIGYGSVLRKDLTGSLSSVSAEDFESQPVQNLHQVLQGRAAGVDITTTSGAPGANLRVRIRGSNSVNFSNEPLYVIDGISEVPIGGIIGGQQLGLPNINPDDIADIQILKDASATALYGNRGANGVVLITTKKGQEGKTTTSFNYNFGIYEVPEYGKLDLFTNAYDYLSWVDSLGNTAGFRNFLRGIDKDSIETYKGKGGTDWQEEVLRRAYSHQYQLSISGGNETAKYFLSSSYLDQEGILLNTSYKNFTLRSNIDIKLNERISLMLNANLGRQWNHNNLGLARMVDAILYSPHLPVKDEEGVWSRDPYAFANLNPVAIQVEDNGDLNENYAKLKAGATINLLEGLVFTSYFGINYNTFLNRRFGTGNTWAGTSNPNNAYYSNSDGWNVQNTNMLNYKRDILTQQNIEITLVNEWSSSFSNGFSYDEHGIPGDYFSYYKFGLGSEYYPLNSGYSQTNLLSFLGRVNYNIREKYLITLAGRWDASSKFQGDNKWGFFPSGAVAWRVSEEPFMQNLDFIYSLKLRASFGKTGNQAIGAYSTLGALGNDIGGYSYSYDLSDYVIGYGIGGLENPTLTWEETKQTNIGLDFSILRGRLALTFDAFQKITDNLLFNRQVAMLAGGGSQLVNLGSVSNKGIDVTLSFTPVQTSNFTWNSDFIGSFVKNEIIELYRHEPEYRVAPSGWNGMYNCNLFKLEEGLSLSTFYLLNYEGVWQEEEADTASLYRAVPGDPKYTDVDGDHRISERDQVPQKDGIPDFTWGWNNTLTYKNFSLNFFFRAAHNKWLFNHTYNLTLLTTGNKSIPTHKDFVKFWRPDNPTNDMPLYLDDTNLKRSTFLMHKADFLKLQNITLTYSLNRNILKFVDIKFSVSAQNVLTITSYKGFDPELILSDNQSTDSAYGFDGGGFPVSRSVTFGVSAKF